MAAADRHRPPNRVLLPHRPASAGTRGAEEQRVVNGRRRRRWSPRDSSIRGGERACKGAEGSRSGRGWRGERR